jgi:protein-S-isoprenylcysteine O-methyltransferase Ste14
MNKTRALFSGAIVLYFIIGLEILIMVSPFAAFFYAAFDPFLLSLMQHPATRWLTAFFLPHMVLPPGIFLKAVRVSGSVMFVAGAAIFLVCAGQVYYNKFFKKGVALRGLYSYIRHPQYLGLGLTGLGLSILWPRFLTITLWTVMLVLYYLLAKDEERRMANQFGSEYREYMSRTGMFFPKSVEGVFRMLPLPAGARAALGLILIGGITLGGAFALRSYTVSHLPLWSSGQVTVLAILPDDLEKLDHRMAGVLDLPEIKTRLQNNQGPFLVYFMPKNYVMQGMIADTGGTWKLYKQHHTMANIADWIFHPFGHIENGGHIMQHDMRHGMDMQGGGVVRRMIFLRVETEGGKTGASALFGINSRRVPLFMMDVDIHNLTMKDVKNLPAENGWGRLPTPIF